MKQSQIIKEIKEKKELAKSWRTSQNYESDWDDYRRIMRVEADDDTKENRKNAGAPCLVDPFLFSLIQHTVSSELLSLFTNKPLGVCIPVEGNDEEGAKILNALLKYQLRDEKVMLKIASWIMESLYLGLSVLKVVWDFDKKDIDIEHIDLKNYYPSPASSSPLNEDIPWCFHRVIKSLKKMKEAGYYQNLSKIDPDDEKIEDSTLYTKSERQDKITLWEYWDDKMTATITEGGVLVRPYRENIYKHKRKPFIVLPDTLEPHKLYGMGEVKPNQDLHLLSNDLHSLRLYNLLLTLMPPIVVSRQSNIEDEGKPLTNLKPGRVIRADGDPTKALYQFIFRDVTASTYAEIASLQQAQRYGTGVMQYSQGEAPQRRETATAVTSLQQLASIRFKAKLLIHSAIFKDLLAMMTDLNQQFMPENKIVVIMGEKGQNPKTLKIPNRNAIKGRYDYDFRLAAVDPEAVKSVKRRQLMEVFQMVLAAQQLPPDIKTKFLNKVLDTFEDPTLKDILPSEEDEKAKQMLTQLVQGLGAGGQPGAGTAPNNVPTPQTPEQGTFPTALKTEAGAAYRQ